MTLLRWPVALACAWACACGAPTAAATSPQAPLGVAAVASPAPAPAIDAGVSQEETLAAIQKAMNDLAPVAQQCWAKAATERFDIEGTIEASVTVSALVDVSLRVVGLPQGLVLCMKSVLEQYTWAPPLRGQSFRLPFKFTAPDGQSVIDRQLVDAHVQGNTGVRVLLDENNTGNAAASMFELQIAPGLTGLRRVDRAELWYFLDAADVGVLQQKTMSWAPVAPGDMLFVPEHGMRSVRATTGSVRAVVVAVPGGLARFQVRKCSRGAGSFRRACSTPVTRSGSARRPSIWTTRSTPRHRSPPSSSSSPRVRTSPSTSMRTRPSCCTCSKARAR
jgi:hypothetical protein